MPATALPRAAALEPPGLGLLSLAVAPELNRLGFVPAAGLAGREALCVPALLVPELRPGALAKVSGVLRYPPGFSG